MEKYGNEYYGLYADIKNNIPDFLKQAPIVVESALRSAMSKGANKIADEALSNLSTRVKGANNPLPEGASLYQGIQCFTWRNSPTATVHILGNQAQNNGTWRLRFYDGGTKDRYHRQLITKPNGRKSRKKTRFIGKIKPTWFFRDAVQANENSIGTFMERAVITKLEKLHNSMTL